MNRTRNRLALLIALALSASSYGVAIAPGNCNGNGAQITKFVVSAGGGQAVQPRGDVLRLSIAFFHNPPTPAVARFAALPDWDVLVVGDVKTPPAWHCPAVSYVSVEMQKALPFKTVQHLPWNHYARKMIGYLLAAREGAVLLAESDNDNLPDANWQFPAMAGRYDHVPEGCDIVNIYSLFTRQPIWPRGFPLTRITAPASTLDPAALAPHSARIGIWQALADDDPDDRMLTQQAFREHRLANDLRFVEDGEQLLSYLRREGAFADLRFEVQDRGAVIARVVAPPPTNTGGWVGLVGEWRSVSRWMAASGMDAARSWLVGPDGWVLADSRSGAPEERVTGDGPTTTWAQRTLYRLVAGGRTRVVDAAGSENPARLDGPAVRRALAGTPAEIGTIWGQINAEAVKHDLEEYYLKPARARGPVSIEAQKQVPPAPKRYAQPSPARPRSDCPG